jgi:hypothetical protein
MKTIGLLFMALVLAVVSYGVAQERKATPLDSIKALAGPWVGATPERADHVLEFKVIANGSAVVENMFPGTKMEMCNVYHMDGDKLMVTHYCAQGIQPRMRADEVKDGVVKFSFVDSTNLKSRDMPHMDSLELNMSADKLTEKRDYFANGKVTEHAVFEFKRKG